MDRLLPLITLLDRLDTLPLTFLVEDNVDITVIRVISWLVFRAFTRSNTLQHHNIARLKDKHVITFFLD